MQVTGAIQELQGMHRDARCVLMSEIVCDTVYTLFFGGFRFTYDKDQSQNKICPNTSPIADIQSEIQHRLGYIPERTKTEGAQRQLVDLLIVNNLAFHRQKCDDAVYNMRNKISYPDIGSEGELAYKLRLFKNGTRAHHSNARRLINAHHLAYKRAVGHFFQEISLPVAQTCADWLCRESREVAEQKSLLLASLGNKVTALEHAARR